MRDSPGRQVLRSFVRSESSWESLRDLGAELTVDGDELRLDEPADVPVYEASIDDVATGLVVSWAQGGVQDWARVLLATGMVDLTSLEDHEAGNELLEAVWDAASGSEVKNDHLGLAQRLARSE